MSHNRKIGLDVVRTVAILSVLVCHFLNIYTPINVAWIYPLGTFGVEIFFVLSGYLIGGILLKSIDEAGGVVSGPLVREFWVRRWMRTIPNYILFGLVYARLSHWHDSKGLLMYLTFTQNLAWRVGEFFDGSWSLAVEEWFYLLLPVLILAVYRYTRNARVAVLTAATTLLVVPLAARMVFGPGMEWGWQVRKIVVFRLDALMFGVLMAYVERFKPAWFARMRRLDVFAGSMLLGAIAFAYITARYVQTGAPDFISTPLDTFVFCLISAACAGAMPLCAGIGRMNWALSTVFYRISLWSYSMYLCHFAVMQVTFRLRDMLMPGLNNAVLALITAAAVFALSAAVYHWFELPIMRLRDRFTSPHKKSVAPSAAEPEMQLATAAA